MRILIDIQLSRPNRIMDEALREISERHGIGAVIPYERQDHETYDIAMSALQPRHRWRYWRTRRHQ